MTVSIDTLHLFFPFSLLLFFVCLGVCGGVSDFILFFGMCWFCSSAGFVYCLLFLAFKKLLFSPQLVLECLLQSDKKEIIHVPVLGAFSGPFKTE